MTIQFSSYYLTCVLLVSWSLQSTLAQLAKLFIYAGLNVVCLSVCVCVWILTRRASQIVANAQSTQILVILHAHTQATNEPSPHTKSQASLFYFTGHNRPPKKWTRMGIFKPAEPHSYIPRDARFVFGIRCILFSSSRIHQVERLCGEVMHARMGYYHQNCRSNMLRQL